MYLPSIIIVGFYFDSHRALATGLAVCGSGVGMFVFAPLADWLLTHYGWQGANWVIAAIILNGVALGALFRPLTRTRSGGRKPSARETMMQKIQRERDRRRTVSTGSLDGALITRDNVFIKDERLIRTILATYDAPPQDNGRKTVAVPEDRANRGVGTRPRAPCSTVIPRPASRARCRSTAREGDRSCSRPASLTVLRSEETSRRRLPRLPLSTPGRHHHRHVTTTQRRLLESRLTTLETRN